VSRNSPHNPRATDYSPPTLMAKFTTPDAEGTPVDLDGANIMLPISIECPMSWKQSLKALLIALSQEPDKTVTFIIADSLQRHTLYMKNLGYILKLEASEFTNADIDTYVRDRMGLRDLHKDLLKISDPTQRKTRFQSDILGALTKQVTRKGAGWRETTQKVIDFLAKTAHEAHGITPPITYPQVFSDGDRLRCIHWDALLSRDDYDRLREHINVQYEGSADFREIIELTSETFINKKLHQTKQDREYPEKEHDAYPAFLEQLKKYSVEYLLEEAAITIGLMQSGEYSVLAYPFGEQATNKPLFDLIQSLAKTVHDQMPAADDDLVSVPRADAAAHPPKVQPVAIHYTKRPKSAAAPLPHMNIPSHQSAFSSPPHSNGTSPRTKPKNPREYTSQRQLELELELEKTRLCLAFDHARFEQVFDLINRLNINDTDRGALMVQLASNSRSSPPPAPQPEHAQLTAKSLAKHNEKMQAFDERAQSSPASPTSEDMRHILEIETAVTQYPRGITPSLNGSWHEGEATPQRSNSIPIASERQTKSAMPLADLDSGNGSYESTSRGATPSPTPRRPKSAPNCMTILWSNRRRQESRPMASPPPIAEHPEAHGSPGM
jgi:hypothetical protein